MSIKFDIDVSQLERELVRGLESKFDAAYAAAADLANREAQDTAMSQLSRGQDLWMSGYSFQKISNNVFIMSMSGKLASMMEDGIKVGEISKLIMNGNRARHNASEGKDYVDVPIPAENMQVSFHRDADALMSSFKRKEVKISDWKNGGIKKEQRMVRRVTKAVIESRKTLSDENPAFLTIKRVTKDSVWPKNPFKGVRAFEKVAKSFADNLIKILEASL